MHLLLSVTSVLDVASVNY